MLRFVSLEALNTHRCVPRDITVVVLMCCFNRRAKTLDALRCLDEQRVTHDVVLAAVLFDDNSEDGTREAVSEAFPQVAIVCGDGRAYWSRGMAQAQAMALQDARPDYLCWLNDDVMLQRDALDVLLATARASGDEAAVVGALTDMCVGGITYSGYFQMGPRPTQVRHAIPNGRPKTVDTFNGNLVLVPRAVYDRIGSIDPRYEHSYGDTDYGYRIRQAGLRSILAPQILGCCPRNSLRGTWRDSRLSLRTRLGLLVSRKGVPPRSYLYYQRRHGGRRWLVNVAGTYLHALGMIYRTRGRVGSV